MITAPAPSQIWLEAWFVQYNGHLSWRAERFTSPNGLHKQIDLWATHYLFPGKKTIVSFYSHDTMTREIALAIAVEVVLGRVIEIPISLKD